MSSIPKKTVEDKEVRPFFNREFGIKVAFVLVSALLWFLTKLSQDDYTDKIVYGVTFQNQAIGKVISDVSSQELSIEVEGNGYDLLSVNTSLKNQKLVLSLEEADKIDANTYSWDTRKNMDVIVGQLPSKFRVKKVTPKSIVVKTDNLKKRTVEVLPSFKLKLKSPLRVYGSVKVIPAQVDLWVPSSAKDSNIVLNTEQFTIARDVGQYQMSVQLNQLPRPYKAEPRNVKVTYEVRAFTQKVIEVPIQVKNLPVQGQVRLFPEKVKVTMNISQEDYDLVGPEDFTCIADFKNIDSEYNRVSLALNTFPEHIELIDWGQKSAEFIIINK